MSHKSVMIAAAIGLCSVTLAGCVSESGPYESRGPSVYRERVVIEPRGDYQRRTPDYDRRDERDRDRDVRRDDDRNDYRDRDRRRCVAPNCVDPEDDSYPQYDRRSNDFG